jgi:type IV secretory pathway VirB4 component
MGWNACTSGMAFQAIRKQEGAIFPVLQTINQLPKDKAASQAIIDNCEVLIVLAGANYEAIQERFNLPTHALYLMRSMKNQQETQKPAYRGFHKEGRSFLCRKA